MAPNLKLEELMANILLKLGPKSEKFYFVLESGHLERQKASSEKTTHPVSGAEGTLYCPPGFGV